MKWDWMVKTIRFAVNRSPAGGKAGYGVIRAVPANDCAGKKSQALRRGGCQVLYAEDNWWYLSACCISSVYWWQSTVASL